MKFSVITVVFNNEKTIADAIRSVLSQSHRDLEYIVIDGASTDGTLEIIRSFGNAVSLVVSEPDKGIYDAMNKGIRLAKGDVIGILNSDDLYADENVLEKVNERFERSGLDAVYGDLEYVDSIDTSRVIRKWRAGSFKKDAFLYGWMPPHPTFFVRKELYERHGMFNLLMKSAADYELMLRFMYKNGVLADYIPELLVRMRIGGISNAGLKSRLRANREDRSAWHMNDLKPYFFTTWLKPIRKILQYRIHLTRRRFA